MQGLEVGASYLDQVLMVTSLKIDFWLLQQALVYHALKSVGAAHWGNGTLIAVWAKTHEFCFRRETHISCELSV